MRPFRRAGWVWANFLLLENSLQPTQAYKGTNKGTSCMLKWPGGLKPSLLQRGRSSGESRPLNSPSSPLGVEGGTGQFQGQYGGAEGAFAIFFGFGAVPVFI